MGVKEKESMISMVCGLSSVILLSSIYFGVYELLHETFDYYEVLDNVLYYCEMVIHCLPILAIIFGMISLKSKKVNFSRIGIFLGVVMVISDICFIWYELTHFTMPIW